MNPIYILGAGNFAQEVYSEVFLQGDASHGCDASHAAHG